MSGLDRVTTADGRILTDAETAAHAGIVTRLSWASLHWGAEDLHPDALPHIAIAAIAAAAQLIEAQVRESIAAEIEMFAMEPEQTPGYTEGSSLFSVMRAHEYAARIARGESR